VVVVVNGVVKALAPAKEAAAVTIQENFIMVVEVVVLVVLVVEFIEIYESSSVITTLLLLFS
jgi:hypothetical protein